VSGRGVAVIFVVGLGGCAEVMYGGPRRSEEEVAILESKDAAIVGIDAQPVEGHERYEMLPGPRAVTVRLSAVRSDPLSVRVYSSARAITVCFVARPGRVYLAMPEILGDGRWAPQIVDERDTYPVAVHHPGEGDRNCRAPRLAPPERE
jgi:hypothetical protein